jgi:hypothetical protein
MQITGTITNVNLPDSTDKWQNQWQNIVITQADGTRVAGRIGSKRGYNGGEQITAQVNEGQYDDGSPKITFKRIDPQQAQYAPQQGQYAPQNAPQAPQQPPQATKPPQQGRNGREVSIERQAAFKAACEYAGRVAVDGETLIKIAIAGHYFIETGKNAYLIEGEQAPF